MSRLDSRVLGDGETSEEYPSSLAIRSNLLLDPDELTQVVDRSDRLRADHQSPLFLVGFVDERPWNVCRQPKDASLGDVDGDLVDVHAIGAIEQDVDLLLRLVY